MLNQFHRPIKIAILAMGGDGGGVVADWLVTMAEEAGLIAQSTSVPGVAQRTGATIYYVEIFDGPASDSAGKAPVLALMPTPGDVDLVIASELMEAARAVQRGLVTPGVTTVVTSTHRVYAIAEKIAMGDGRSDPNALLADVQSQSLRFVGFDMATLAKDHGTVVSAVLFGAVAAVDLLPFSRKQFEDTITRSGVGVQSSLAAFAAAHDVVTGEVSAPSPQENSHQSGQRDSTVSVFPFSQEPSVQKLLDDLTSRNYPLELRDLVLEGLRRLVDYQDVNYASEYLERLKQHPAMLNSQSELSRELARHLALWMSFEDTIRVADLKIRASRFDRIADETRAEPKQILQIEEYLHPRLQEVADTLPAWLGKHVIAGGWVTRLVYRLADKGRRVQTTSVRGFLVLWLVSRLRPLRRATLRFQKENTQIEQWLQDVATAVSSNEGLALELVKCQKLIKGYGQTHERGVDRYYRIRAEWVRGADSRRLARLREAALADEMGLAFTKELQSSSI